MLLLLLLARFCGTVATSSAIGSENRDSVPPAPAPAGLSGAVRMGEGAWEGEGAWGGSPCRFCRLDVFSTSSRECLRLVSVSRDLRARELREEELEDFAAVALWEEREMELTSPSSPDVCSERGGDKSSELRL
jgi:hypothetical protein